MSREIAPSPVADRLQASDLITSLREKAPRVALALAAGQAAWPVARYIRAQAKERTTYTVKVPGNDDIYDDLHEWVLSLLPAGRQRALIAWSSRRDELIAVAESHRPPAPGLRLRYDGARQQVVSVAGHKIRVSVSDGAGSDDGRNWKPPEIMFTAQSAGARDSLLEQMAVVLRSTHKRRSKPSFRMLGKWGDWERMDEIAPRDPDSVILPRGQMERLIDDVGRFLAAEHDYQRRCIPWHRGHLYEGPPGTGKTSVARAVASHFGMDVWYLPLADVKKDGDLLRNVARAGPRSMLLLEDIDVFHAATERGQEAERVTLSGLLNTLDGIATPHGLLTVLTTNTPEVLDDAVVRPGRVDLIEHFSLAGPDEVGRIVARYYDQPCPDAAGIRDIAPADVVEACKRHDDPAGAIAELAARSLECVA